MGRGAVIARYVLAIDFNNNWHTDTRTYYVYVAVKYYWNDVINQQRDDPAACMLDVNHVEACNNSLLRDYDNKVLN